MSSTPTDCDDDEKRTDAEIANLRATAETVRDDLHAFADALEDGAVGVDELAGAICSLSFAYVDLEDAAHEAGVIDSTADEWRAIDQARIVMLHAAHAADLDENGENVIAPTARGEWDAAISAATSAAEYAEQARDDEGDA